MHIEKISITDFKCYQGEFTLDLNPKLNILVGDNETGKSTILEAIHLALSGWFRDRPLAASLTQSLFNSNTISEYLASLKTTEKKPPPKVSIELFLKFEEDDQTALFEGDRNSTGSKACGLCFGIYLSEKYKKEYESLLESADEISSLPIEYYEFGWSTFSRDDQITPRSIPLRSAYIDSTANRSQNGADVQLSRIIRDVLEDKEKISISQAHRKMKEGFSSDDSIVKVNEKLKEYADLTEKEIELLVDVSTKSAWETSLITHVDQIPFSFIGKGEQSLIKTKLALAKNSSSLSNVLLVEEPENHLSHTKLNKLLEYIEQNNLDKQVLVTTHSSFVLNKLGLGNLILLNADTLTRNRNTVRITSFEDDTEEFFAKLPGYDTLRFVLSRRVILVEGPSDELIVQRAYKDMHDKLPISDEIEVISVGTSFLRFLKLADELVKKTCVVTDTDSDVTALEVKYEEYIRANKKNHIDIFYDSVIDAGGLKIGDKPFNYNTLEPKIVKENTWEAINTILEKENASEDELHKYMRSKKTECALQIFTSEEKIKYPAYILSALSE